MKQIIFCINLLLCVIVYAQDANKVLSVRDMHADLDFYFTALQDIHPNPFVILSEQEFRNKIDSIKQRITEPISKKEFYLHISSLNSYTDLHTCVVGSKKMMKQLQRYYSFPVFAMQDTDNDVFFYDTDSVKHTVKSINGINTQQIIDFFLSRRNLVETNSEYNFRDVLYFYLDQHVISGNVSLVAARGDNRDSIFLYPALLSQKDSKGQRIYRLETDSLNSVALFELNTFMPKKFSKRIGFEKMLNKIFDTLKAQNINRLYIDLTCNNGGLIAFEEYLLNFLITDKHSKVSWDLIMKQSKQRRKQRGLTYFVSDGDYHQTRHYFTPSCVDNKFKGEVYVIQSRLSFSAASTLSAHLQTYRQSKVIGEESQIKAVYTDPIVITLPHSKFLFSCATGFIKNVGTMKTKGVIPDIYQKIYNPYEEISVQQAEQMIKPSNNHTMTNKNITK